jgi:hypothetical protein
VEKATSYGGFYCKALQGFLFSLPSKAPPGMEDAFAD